MQNVFKYLIKSPWNFKRNISKYSADISATIVFSVLHIFTFFFKYHIIKLNPFLPYRVFEVSL